LEGPNLPAIARLALAVALGLVPRANNQAALYFHHGKYDKEARLSSVTKRHLEFFFGRSEILELMSNGLTLRQIRKAAGLSQESLAALCGVHRRTVARWEKGEIAIKPLQYEGFLQKIREFEALRGEINRERKERRRRKPK
jgi:DNA-binding transcriptional regulator YiaG